MYRRILVPLDGSQLAEEALRHAVQVASCTEGASITLIQVVGTIGTAVAADPMGASAGEAMAAMEAMDAAESAAGEYLDELSDGELLRGVPTRKVVVRGNAATEIVQYAHDNRIDLIAMSTHGRSGLGRLVFGSVADQVLRESGVPILLIRSRPESVAQE